MGRLPDDERRGVYLFPVVADHLVTHQWSREILRTAGRGRVVAVRVRLPGAEPVTVGRYDGAATGTSVAEAVAQIMRLDDSRGWEVLLPRVVAAAEVRGVRELRRPVGWRHVPDAHGTAPCTCLGCRDRGGFGSRRLRERRSDPVDGPWPRPSFLLDRLGVADAADADAIVAVLDGFGGRRRGPVARLAHLAEHPDAQVRVALVSTIDGWSTPGAREVVERLAEDPDEDVRETARAWLSDED